jgi:ankyrin repeat protein
MKAILAVAVLLMLLFGCCGLTAADYDTTESPTDNLWTAVYSNDSTLAEIAISNGADANAKNPYGAVMLKYSSCAGYTDIVRVLIKGGADVNYKNEYNDTALSCASQHEYEDIAQMLRDAGAK